MGGAKACPKTTGPILFKFAENLYFTPTRYSQDFILTNASNQPTFRPKFARSCYVNVSKTGFWRPFRAAQISKSELEVYAHITMNMLKKMEIGSGVKAGQRSKGLCSNPFSFEL